MGWWGYAKRKQFTDFSLAPLMEFKHALSFTPSPTKEHGAIGRTECIIDASFALPMPLDKTDPSNFLFCVQSTLPFMLWNDKNPQVCNGAATALITTLSLTAYTEFRGVRAHLSKLSKGIFIFKGNQCMLCFWKLACVEHLEPISSFCCGDLLFQNLPRLEQLQILFCS